ncbi:MAG: flagellar hook-associated protein FlgK [Myxococcales bacterium]|nr:flagellar hook-associated protein FlgK [Myxococcales bacterium]
MGMLDTVRVSATGLSAASAGVRATAQNVTNATTPGFTRRSVVQSVSEPLRDGVVLLGQGVSVDAITSDRANLLGMRQLRAAGDSSGSATYRQALAEVEPVVNEVFADGPRSGLAAFFDTLTAATVDPSDPGLRESVLRQADGLADQVQRAANGFSELQSSFSDQMAIEIPPLTQKLQQVAMLNRQLQSAGGAAQAPDIADDLNRLLRELGEQGGFTAHIQSDGIATVMLDGHAVVYGETARAISVDSPNAVRIQVDEGYVTATPGGALGGLARAYDTVQGYIDQLDTFAADFADAVNTTLAGGFDQDGNAGAPLFTYTAGDAASSLAVSATATSRTLAFAGSATAAAGDGVNLDALLALESSAVVGGQTPADALSALTNDVSLDISSAAVTAVRDGLVSSDLDQLAASLHGVDLDEQAVQLTAYQTAYQASARVLTVANDLLGTLLELA